MLTSDTLPPPNPRRCCCALAGRWARELERLVARCRASAEAALAAIDRAAADGAKGSARQPEGELFCVAGVEALPFAAQDRLVQAVQALSRAADADEGGAVRAGRPLPFRIALILAGAAGQHVADAFSGAVHAGAGLADAAFAALVAPLCASRGVVALTSDRPGLGKTERVRSP